MNTIAGLEKRGKSFWAAIGLFFISVVGLLDYLTGYELSFSLFYLIPISLVVWFAGRRLGVAASIVSSLAELVVDILTGDQIDQPGVYFWNAALRFGFFIIVTLLLATLKKALEHERNLSRTDYLTGATSAGFFYGLLQTEMDRFRRYGHPFTLAYVDIDDFRVVNDRFGHPVGDNVLHSIVTLARHGLRKTDIVARLGGDEFAILLPETNPQTAQGVISKIQHALLGEMSRSQWPVTFSTGVITFTAMPATTNELIKMVDDLMYSVKHNGKNAVSFAVYAG